MSPILRFGRVVNSGRNLDSFASLWILNWSASRHLGLLVEACKEVRSSSERAGSSRLQRTRDGSLSPLHPMNLIAWLDLGGATLRKYRQLQAISMDSLAWAACIWWVCTTSPWKDARMVAHLPASRRSGSQRTTNRLPDLPCLGASLATCTLRYRILLGILRLCPLLDSSSPIMCRLLQDNHEVGQPLPSRGQNPWAWDNHHHRPWCSQASNRDIEYYFRVGTWRPRGR